MCVPYDQMLHDKVVIVMISDYRKSVQEKNLIFFFED